MDATLKQLIDERVHVVGEIIKAVDEPRREWLVEKRIEIMTAMMTSQGISVATARDVADAIIKRKLSMDRFLTIDRIQTGKLPDIDQDLGTRKEAQRDE